CDPRSLTSTSAHAPCLRGCSTVVRSRGSREVPDAMTEAQENAYVFTRGGIELMQVNHSYTLTAVVAFASCLALAACAEAATVANPLCPDNTALFDPGTGQNIVLPAGFTVSVFAQGLNMPTGIAFRGTAQHFQVYVLESGHGLPSVCNEQGGF